MSASLVLREIIRSAFKPDRGEVPPTFSQIELLHEIIDIVDFIGMPPMWVQRYLSGRSGQIRPVFNDVAGSSSTFTRRVWGVAYLVA